MPTRTIPKDRWNEFLDWLSHDHWLHPVTVQMSDAELGFQIEMTRVPLIGVTADLEAGGGPRLEVMVGRSEVDHTAHSIANPTAIRLEEDDQGEPQVLEIEAGNGSKTLVILKPAEFGEPGELATRP